MSNYKILSLHIVDTYYVIWYLQAIDKKLKNEGLDTKLLIIKQE